MSWPDVATADVESVKDMLNRLAKASESDMEGLAKQIGEPRKSGEHAWELRSRLVESLRARQEKAHREVAAEGSRKRIDLLKLAGAK